jgi:hypothetical protein
MGKIDPVVLNQITDISKNVEINSSYIDDIVDKITEPFMKDLDKCVKSIQMRIQDKVNPPTDAELDSFCLDLSTMIYFAGEGAERIGIRDGVAKTTYKEAYNAYRLAYKKGTAVDKTNAAELQSLKESVVSMAYNSAYKSSKAKVDYAIELLASIKKIISRRQDELKLTRMSN